MVMVIGGGWGVGGEVTLCSSIYFVIFFHEESSFLMELWKGKGNVHSRCPGLSPLCVCFVLTVFIVVLVFVGKSHVSLLEVGTRVEETHKQARTYIYRYYYVVLGLRYYYYIIILYSLTGDMIHDESISICGAGARVEEFPSLLFNAE